MEGMFVGVCPDRRNGAGVFMIDGKLAQRSNPWFKVMDVHAVELHEANELSNIPDQFRLRPS